MLFSRLRTDEKRVNISLKKELWLLGEILLNECNAKSLDVFGCTLYLDAINNSRKSIYIDVDAYKTKYNVYDIDGELLKYNGIAIRITYPDKNIYDMYSDRLGKRILRINYLSFNNKYEVPFNFHEAKIIHCLDGKKRISEIKSKDGYRNFTKLKTICDEII